MSLLGRLFETRDAPGPAGERRTLTGLNSFNAAFQSDPAGFGADSGEFVSERTALRLGVVYACVRLLGDSMSSLPMRVYRRQGSIRQEVEPTPSMIRKPFADLTRFEWTFATIASLALRGNAYHRIVARDTLEFPTELMPLHPDCVSVECDPDTGETIYRVDGERVPRHDILHIRRFVLPGYALGLSPIGNAAQSIGLGLAAERFGSRWFGDSANPSSILRTDQDLNDDQIAKTQRSWIQSHGGRRLPAVLTGGFEWKPISIAPAESQFLETRQYQRGEIAMMFGVPPHMIGDTQKSTSWGSGIEQQSIGFVTYTLRPWLTCIEDALSDLLPRGQFVKFNVAGLIRGDIKTRYDSYTQARNAGWLSVDEIRELEDRPPLPDGAGSTYLQPLNMVPLGTEVEETAPTVEPNEDEGTDEE